MHYNKNSFLAGLSVGRTLKGWSGGSASGPAKIVWSKICGGDFSTTSQNRIIAIGWACGFYYVIQKTPNAAFISGDAVSWSNFSIPLSDGEELSSFYAQGNGLFAIATTGNRYAVTSDFQTWRFAAPPYFGTGRVEYQSGRFWITDEGSRTSYVVSTADFLQFESVSISGNLNDSSPTEAGFSSRTNSGLAVTSQAILVSRSGKSVSSFYLETGCKIQQIIGALGNCVFVCQNSAGNIVLQYSVDGSSWDQTDSGILAYTYGSAKIIGDGRLWVKGSDQIYAVTGDLKTIESVTLPGSSSIAAYFRGIYFAGAGLFGSPVYTSANLAQWSAFEQLQSAVRVLTANTAVFVVGADSLGSPTFVSFDGSTWDKAEIIPNAIFEKDGVIIASERIDDGSGGWSPPVRSSAYVGVIQRS